jgi:hypothetical protein
MSGAEYEPATILLLDRDMNETDSIEVLFNPTQYSVDKSVEYGEVALPGMDTPVSQFVSGDAESLSMDLLVDTYESGEDVSDHIAELDRLVSVDGERHAPPICKFVWGDLSFTAIVESLKKEFTLFMPDGRPVRATVSLSLKRYETVTKQIESEPRSSADRTKVRRVTGDQSLWAIAAAEYGDPGEWRRIADANGISDPRSVAAGTELVVPSIDS